MANIRHATCSCAQLRLVCVGEPVRVSMCHCQACQRRTGSAFGVQARFARGQVTTSGDTAAFLRVADSGNEVRFHFCPRCGATVFWHPAVLPEFTVVAVGAFADAAFPAPQVSVFESRRHAWVQTPSAIQHVD